ncbi:MAG: bifunctional UDP-N-acetylglucosamine diphosphorylase/glucosamine-1-phosphate N-acetyltransferase GlmU [Alphaproteobacteria bacterium]|nr:bifunctional UDP-N-acetylglucosamine diphosphorylase/glucosamine-1-phosphate N-acetyltransferase GlmU [Alphaproteobacteria bacterium]
MTQPLTAVILAAGLGTRMKSTKFKVLHEIAHRPMIGHVLDAVARLEPERIVAVTGPDQDTVRAVLPEGIPSAVQDRALGTAHAVLAAKDHLAAEDGTVLVLFGADPLIKPETMAEMAAKRARGAAVVLLGFRPADPTGYGRLVTDDSGAVTRIVEHKEASPEELRIGLCNAGVMAIDRRHALTWLERIGNDNAKGEYYLTDIVALARADGGRVDLVEAGLDEVIGVDTRMDLAAAEAEFQRRKRLDVMASGVTLTDPDSVQFAFDTRIGPDSVIEPHVVFGPGVQIADNATIRAFTHIEGATIASGVTVGPYARIRPDTVVAEGARIGNFVELKKTVVGVGAKVPHLSYVGDATIGTDANIGAGTITCNYDGFQKSRTVIGEGAFIGSNTALVAPVVVGAGAIVGAGSTITRDVPGDALAVARGRQEEKPGWAERFRAMRQSVKNDPTTKD